MTYKKTLFFVLFLLNIALYMPSTSEVQADLSSSILKKVDTTYISKINEDTAVRFMSGLYKKARDAKIADLALEKGLTLEEYGQVLDGQFPSCLLESAQSTIELASKFSRMQDMVENDINKANYGLDLTMSTEAFKQYSDEVGAMLKANKEQYIKMYKDAILEMYNQVLDYYKKFPSPPVTACS